MDRTAKTLKNAKVGLVFQILQILAQFACRTVFIRYMPPNYLGVNGIFQNILNILQIAELGFGQAFACSLYKPLSENKTDEIQQIVHFFKKVYLVIASAILLLGLQIIPFMSYIIKDMDSVPHMIVYYLLNLIGVVGQYLFVYNAILIEADQKQYITQIISKGQAVIKNILQMISLVLFSNFLLYLIIQVVFDIGQNIYIKIKTNRMYPYLKDKTHKIESETKQNIVKNVKDIFFHRIGGALMNYTDSIILSSIQGLAQVAQYSNYQLITQNVKTFLKIPFEGARASFGNLQANEDKDKIESKLLDIQFICMFAYGYVAQAMMVVFNQFIEIWAGSDYVFGTSVVFWIVLAFYLDGIRQPVTIAKETMGIFHADKYRELICQVINLVLQVILVLKYGISGVFAGTAISILITTQFIEPMILYKNGLNRQSIKFWFLFFRGIFTTIIQYFISYKIVCSLGFMTNITIVKFIISGFICTFVFQILGLIIFIDKAKLIVNMVKKLMGPVNQGDLQKRH